MNAFEIMDALGGVPAELVETGLQEAPSENAGKRRSSPKRMILRAASAAAAVIAVVIGVRYVRIRALAKDDAVLYTLGFDGSNFDYRKSMQIQIANGAVTVDGKEAPAQTVYMFENSSGAYIQYDSAEHLIAYYNPDDQAPTDAVLSADELMNTALQIAKETDADYQLNEEQYSEELRYYPFRKMIGADAYDIMLLTLYQDGTVKEAHFGYCNLTEDFHADALRRQFETYVQETAEPEAKSRLGSDYQRCEIAYEFYQKVGGKTYASYSVNYYFGDAEQPLTESVRYLIHD